MRYTVTYSVYKKGNNIMTEKRSDSRLWFIGQCIVCALLAAFLVFGAMQYFCEEPEQPARDFTMEVLGIPGDTVVATAENVEVTAEDLFILTLAYAQQNMQYASMFGMDPESMWQMQATETLTMEQYIQKYALEEAAFHSLVRYHAEQEGITLTQEDLDLVDTQMAAIYEAAEQAGMDPDEYMFQYLMTPGVMRRSMESDPLYVGIARKYFGPETEGYPTYEQVQAELEAANAYTVKHILLATVDTTTRLPLDAETAAQKKEQAQLLWDQLTNSEDLMGEFDALMREHSEDPGLATNPDGYTFTDADTANLDPAFDAAAKALQEGEMSAIVEGVSGYHIILRLPLAVDLEGAIDEFVTGEMEAVTAEWIEGLDIQLNETGLTMQPKEIYNKAMDYISANQPDASEDDSSAAS